jgi:pilus assembly protein Flp/PilA
MSFIKSFIKDESGATMIEYGLVAALVSVAAIIALQILGGQLQGVELSVIRLRHVSRPDIHANCVMKFSGAARRRFSLKALAAVPQNVGQPPDHDRDRVFPDGAETQYQPLAA